MIKYLAHKEINAEKWDKCLAQIPFAHFYALYGYLSAICTWDAIVLLDQNQNYIGILPLPFKKKFGIKYLSHPFFCQQLGYFSNHSLETKDVKIIRQMMKKHFLFGQAQWSVNQSFISYFAIEKRKNYELDLNKSIEDIKQNFNINRKRVIKKLLKHDYKLNRSSAIQVVENCIQQMKEEIGDRFPEVHDSDYTNLIKAIKQVSHIIDLNCVSVYDSNTLACESLFVEYNQRIIYLFGYTKTEYTSLGISSLMFLDVIQSEQKSNKILDLEGGNIAGIERFFQSFGANQQEYYHVLLRPLWFQISKIVR